MTQQGDQTLHTISGHNFHGRYEFKIRAPKAGGVLTAGQLARVRSLLCGMSGCLCGGGYGDGPDANSARIADGILIPVRERIG